MVEDDPDTLASHLQELTPGDHLCCLYRTEEEHRSLLTPFLWQGLEQNHRILYVVDSHTADQILDYLREGGLEVERYVQSDQLSICTARDSYLRGGAFDPDAMIALLKEETDRSFEQGYDALRVTGEMSWALGGHPGSDRLIEYETKLNQFLPGSRAIGLCQYDRCEFEPELLKDVLRTHPIAVVGTEVYDNFYYIPPGKMLGESRAEVELNRWVENLSKRKETLQRLRQSERRYRDFFRTSRDPVFITTRDGQWVDVNQAAVELFGYEDSEELKQVPVRQIYADPADRKDHIQVIMEKGFSKQYPVKLRRNDGSTIETRITSVPVEDDHGNVIGFQGIIRDVTERRQMERELRKREKKFRTIFNNANDALYLHEVNDDGSYGHFLEVNETACEMLGYSREEFLRMTPLEIDAEDKTDEAQRAMSELLTKGRETFEMEHVARDGTRVPVEVSSHVFTVGGHKRVLSVVRDITERKQAEQRILHLNSLLRAIRNVNQIIVQERDLDQIAEKSAKALVETRTYQGCSVAFLDPESNCIAPTAEAGDHQFKQGWKVTPDGRGEAPQCVSEALQGGDLDVRYDGQMCTDCVYGDHLEHAGAITVPMRQDSKTVGILHACFSEDLKTDRRERELLREVAQDLGFARNKILAEQNRQRLLKEVGERVKEVRCLYSVSRLASDPATSVEELLGAAVEQMPGGWKYPSDTCVRIQCEDGEFTSPDFRETPWKQSTELTVSGDSEGCIEVFYLQEKPEEDEGPFLSEERELLEELARQIGQAIESRRARDALQDALEQLKRTRQQVIDQERQRVLSQMASGIAHDFNNALSTIRGFTDLLLQSEEKLEHKETAQRYLQHVRKAASNASETVARLRKFYRPREDEDFGRINLNSLVEEALSMTRPRWQDEALAEGAEIIVERDLHDVDTVQGNEAELHELLTNLIFNAVDAMPEGGTLELRTQEREGDVVLEISDTGVGMSEDARQRCFDPFFTTKQESGTGLGLSIVQGTVERHGGRIEVQSQPGKGTTFRMFLPTAEETEADGAGGADTRPETSFSVLVIEDEAEQRELLTEYLELDDHRVDTAADGREGLTKFSDDRYDVVITDRSMPEMGGDQLAREIKGRAPEKPVIMLTGFGDMMEAEGHLPSGVDLVLSKPVTLNELRQAIARAVSAPDAQ